MTKPVCHRLVCKDWRFIVNNFKPLWSQLRTHDISCSDHNACEPPYYTEYYPDYNEYLKAKKCDRQMHTVRMTVFLEAVKNGHKLTTELLIERGVEIHSLWSHSWFATGSPWDSLWDEHKDECTPIHTLCTPTPSPSLKREE